jgi:tight adherence protein B
MSVVTLVWIGIGMGIILLILGIVVTAVGERSVVDERLDRYLEEEEAGIVDGEAENPLTGWIDGQVERTSIGDRLSRNLAQADLKFKPTEYIGLTLLSMGAVGFLGFIWGGFIMAGLGAIILGPLAPWLYVKRQQTKRLENFNNQLPDMLNLVVNGLRAGYSTMQAMESVSKELPNPISAEFRRVVREMQLGIPMEDALDNLLRRIPSDDLDLIITAINIQREVGGNLAEILDIISYTIRERIRIKREIQVLVSQVLYSGRILAIMPVALAFFLWGANESYMQQFFLEETRACGIPMLTCGGLMIMAGYFVMTRIANIEV